MFSPEFIISITSSLIALATLLILRKGLEQIKISKEDIAARKKTKSIGAALKQVEFYREKVLTEITNVNVEKSVLQIKFLLGDSPNLTNFSASEIRTQGTELNRLYKTDLTTWESTSSTIHSKIQTVANTLESFSMAFTSGYADKDLVLLSLGETFCRFVKENAIYYCTTEKMTS